MTRINWTDDFSIGNKKLDTQHKKWINIFNEAHDKMMTNNPIDSLSDIGKDALKEMIEYGKYHFSSEEKFMEEIGFSEIETHKRIHNDFAQKLDGLALQMHQGTHLLNSEIIKTIENWLVNHILKEDQKFII